MMMFGGVLGGTIYGLGAVWVIQWTAAQYYMFLACCQGSKPVFIPFSDSRCVFLVDSRILCIYLQH